MRSVRSSVKIHTHQEARLAAQLATLDILVNKSREKAGTQASCVDISRPSAANTSPVSGNMSDVPGVLCGYLTSECR